ncbi:hypothetical protein TIFTF001_037330 [Ficus carica]|uniref:Uncharacterized protein n=1 Tax=Ficus carica TaxID=3494 RepID=A0AA88CLG9_FICCA|nr:hypothetical protein TIFTF001_049254 [Ficus carica]GMN68276.1 hypothetical protein TIFTF001_037330 [Ficus carica]
MAISKSKRGLCPHNPPASSLAAMMMIVAAVILINANSGGAAVLVKSNATYGCFTGREEECLIAEDLDLEYLFMEYSSHAARVLQTIDPSSVGTQANKPETVPCPNGMGNQYNCDTMKNKKKAPKCRDKYDRTPGCVR